MKQYLSLVQEILDNGEKKEDRTGTGTLSIFGVQRKYDLREGFPLLTTKKVLFKGILHELLWFLRGATNINDDLTQHTPIWDAWADENGDLGPIYGKQWRAWRKADGTEVDQIKQVIDLIKNNPDSRRIIVNAWNVGELDQMALPPCHMFFQFYVAPGKDGSRGRLDCQLYQRSADVALGVPFNIASYAILMHMIAQECELEAGIFTHTIGDAHIYLNHIEGMCKQLTRTPKALPQLKLANKPLDQLTFDDFEVIGYEHDPFIKFKVAV
jgi:thymidylate synthase